MKYNHIKEEILHKQDAKLAVEYCINANEKWPEAETFIINNFLYAFIYARNVIKGRWPIIESKYIDVSRNKVIRYFYCKYFFSDYNQFLPFWKKSHTDTARIMEYFY